MAEEKIKSNIPAGEHASPPAANPQAAPASEQDQYLFYNVMPKNRGTAGIIAPTVTVMQSENTENAQPSGMSMSFSKYKLYVYIALGILLLAIPGWFIYKHFSNPYDQVSILTKNSTGTIPSVSTSTPQSNVTLSKEWLAKYFGSESCADPTLCGPLADPDHDGLNNVQEFKLGTDPNNADSDKDGLADGDEVNVFLSNPLNARTAKDPQYSDGDFLKGGYDIATNQKMSSDQIQKITGLMAKFGLHEPTITTLGLPMLSELYHFSPANTPATATTTPTTLPATTSPAAASSTVDQSPEAKQDRDAQRTTTIKNIEIALVKYQEDHTAYPATAVFADMVTMIKPYNRVATNPIDPINKIPYVYSYVAEKNNTDFTLSFYSETVNQIIKKHAAEALKDKNDSEASGFDDRRKSDLEEIRSALLLYSNNAIAGDQQYSFPTIAKYKTSLVPQYISAVPKDPTTGSDYEYKVADTFDTFTLKAFLQNPPTGNTGYICNQEECRYY